MSELLRGFPPISRADARILILGSMPGRESLAQQQYYAHPRNAFWFIFCDLLGAALGDYEQRRQLLLDSRIAVWDVLDRCERPGSLDSAISDQTAKPNDFTGFYRRHPDIRAVFFNGAKAESVYQRRVLPDLPAEFAARTSTRLPSTSPAHASLRPEQKRDAWRVILQALE